MGMGRRVVINFLVIIAFSLVGLEGINRAQANMIDLYNFDFGSNSSPVQTGWLQVTNNTVYSPQLGYGWNASLTATNRSGATPPEYPDMLRDFNRSSSDRTFEIDLAVGTYNIELYFYDNSAHSNNWTVYLGDSSTILATVTALPKNTEVTRQFDITMASAGQLDLRFNKAGTGNWQINGIRVAQEAPVPPTLLLLGTGLLGLKLLGRRRKVKES
jgi:hypothetical protein